MEIVIDNLKVSYNQYGEGKNIVLLHGWGQNKEMMDLLGKKLDGYKITSIDLPGFGKSDEPKKLMTVYDYVHFLHKLIENLKLKDISLIGHSFGARLSLVYASIYKVDKVISLAGPIYKSEVDKTLKVRFLKFLGKIPFLKIIKEWFKNFIGSSDYKNSSEIMRQVLISTINTSVEEDMLKVKIPTLLIWGTKDDAVDVEDERKVVEKMHDAALIEFDGLNHYAYLENLTQVVNIIKNFI